MNIVRGSLLLLPLGGVLYAAASRTHRAEREVLKATLNNNPSYGLLNAWSAMEREVSLKNSFDTKRGKNKQIRDAVSRSLHLSKADQRRLKTLARQRNGVAHALDGRKSRPGVTFSLSYG